MQIYPPGVGCQDCDLPNSVRSADRDLGTVWGHNFSGVAPLQGITFGNENDHQIDVDVDMTALAKSTKM